MFVARAARDGHVVAGRLGLYSSIKVAIDTRYACAAVKRTRSMQGRHDWHMGAAVRDGLYNIGLRKLLMVVLYCINKTRNVHFAGTERIL